MTSNDPAMFVRRGRYVPEHERFEYDSGSVLELDTGKRYTCLASTFMCVCGAQMRDGDNYFRDERTGAIAHENCGHLLGAIS